MTDRSDDPGTALSPQGSARPRLRFVPAATLSIGVTVQVPTPEGQEISGAANPEGGNFLAAGSVALTGTESDGTRHPPWPPDHHRSHLAPAYPSELDYVPPVASGYLASGLIAGDRGGLVRMWLLVIAMAWFAVGLVVALIAPEFSVVIVVALVVLLIPLTFAAAAGPVTTTAARRPDHAYATSSPVSSRRRLVRAEPGDGGAQVGGSANSFPLPSLQHTSHNPERLPVLGNTQVPVQTAPNPYGEAQ